MSAVPAATISSAIPMRVTVAGRVDGSRMYNGQRYTVITVPAADKFAHPAIVEVRSKHQVGATGDEVTVRCQLAGWPRRFKLKNGDQGVSYDLALDVIE